ncbi:MAG: hypothetical protein IPO70_03865 [Bacteroidetes bacterium]|nr:hypothetical protein [Bacteroidota bacterium]MBK9671385.1 hypothetical protein [Bacteroidota bacterium]MBP6412196.1 hypothetical protein [Bacteroidia bacterium]
MKKPASTKKAKTKSDKDFDELRKPAKLKPIKSKEPKRIKNPKLDDEELDMLDDDLGLDDYEGDLDIEDDDF